MLLSIAKNPFFFHSWYLFRTQSNIYEDKFRGLILYNFVLFFTHKNHVILRKTLINFDDCGRTVPLISLETRP